MVGTQPFALFGATDQARGEMLLYKPRSFVQSYLDLARGPRLDRVVELGIFNGGSTAFLAELLRPRSLLAVDLSTKAPAPLMRFLADHPFAPTIHCRFGVDQSDRVTLRALVDELVGTPLDLVVDDASHLLGPTMASFEVLFPLLRPGGTYIIEDWSGRMNTALRVHRKIARERQAAFIEAVARDRAALERMWRAAPDRIRAALLDDGALRAELEGGHPDLVAAILSGDGPPIPAASTPPGFHRGSTTARRLARTRSHLGGATTTCRTSCSTSSQPRPRHQAWSPPCRCVTVSRC